MYRKFDSIDRTKRVDDNGRFFVHRVTDGGGVQLIFIIREGGTEMQSATPAFRKAILLVSKLTLWRCAAK